MVCDTTSLQSHGEAVLGNLRCCLRYVQIPLYGLKRTCAAWFLELALYIAYNTRSDGLSLITFYSSYPHYEAQSLQIQMHLLLVNLVISVRNLFAKRIQKSMNGLHEFSF